MTDPNRGTGRSTRQIQSADPNTLFVVTPASRNYHVHLARDLGRNDITVTTLDVVENYVRATQRPIMIDHSVGCYHPLTEAQRRVVELISHHNAHRKLS